MTINSVPQWPSDISGNDWCGPVNCSLAVDRMSNENFGTNPVFWGRNLSLGPAKNDHVYSFGLAIMWRSEERINGYVIRVFPA